MRDAMIPRGPDGCGLSSGPGYALGHRRLAIIDLSDAGKQPMSSADGSIELVFNGEIYNFLDLRPELEQAGCVFRSHTDSEVLLHGYKQWGIEGLLRRIRGMFAFALLDRQRNEITLARDPLGKKPLFYRWVGGELAFASSARALAIGLPQTPEIDPRAIDDLLWNLYVPGPRSIFCDVEKVLPGRAWILGREAQPRQLVHWHGDFFQPETGISEQAWIERTEAALTTAVKRRFVADVPVGVMLSGGVDSSLVAALAARSIGRVRTFTVANEDPAENEADYALAVARRYDTEHHVLPVRSMVRRDLPRLVAAMGEPMGDSSAANLFAIAELARQSVTVVLTGDGGDEGFGGYTWFWLAHLGEQARRFLPTVGRPPLARLGRSLRAGPPLLRRAGTLLRSLACLPDELIGEGGWIDRETRQALYTPEFRERVGEHSPTEHMQRILACSHGASMPDRVMQAHLQTILAEDYLPKVDLATMGVSLEARCPFLDLDVMELAMRIPAAVRFRGFRPKGLLRKLARKHLPRGCVDRRKKGFSAPIGLWLRKDWPDLVDALILGPQVERRGWFRRETLQRLVAEQREGRSDHAHLLWTLLVLELWVRIAVERTLSPSDQI
jgi:asparagine synthase (glutamine-hydrolysing)